MPRKASGKRWKIHGKGGCGRSRNSSRNSKLSMAYRVSIGPRAERDLGELYLEIDAQESNAAQRWYRGLERAILSLRERPNRAPATPESPASSVRQQTSHLSRDLPND